MIGILKKRAHNIWSSITHRHGRGRRLGRFYDSLYGVHEIVGLRGRHSVNHWELGKNMKSAVQNNVAKKMIT